jgi:hypothetical protein
MSRHQARGSRRPTHGLRQALLAMLFVSLVPTSAGAASLDQTMQPMGRGASKSSPCGTCPAADAEEDHAQRVAERAAPEFPAARQQMPMAAEDADTGQDIDLEPVTSPVIETGTVLSLPGASIPLPVVLQ